MISSKLHPKNGFIQIFYILRYYQQPTWVYFSGAKLEVQLDLVFEIGLGELGKIKLELDPSHAYLRCKPNFSNSTTSKL